MTYETILYESDQGVATITLNRPQQLNAVDRQLADEWRMALAEVDRDERVRIVVITGAGRGFCAGQDLATLKEGLTGGQILREMYNPILLAIRHLPKPVVAAVNGAAVGAGMNLALACDIRFAAEGAVFGEVFARIKAGLNEAYGLTLTNALEWEALGQDAITQTQDFQEGVAALWEKCGATFRGR